MWRPEWIDRSSSQPRWHLAPVLALSLAVLSLVGFGDLVDAYSAQSVGRAALTIDVFTCPAGFDQLDPSLDIETSCVLPTADILFSLVSNGSEVAASTGEGGRPATIQFSGLPAGDSLLIAEMPKTVLSAFVWGCTSNLRPLEDQLFRPLARPDSLGRLEVVLQSGEAVRCSWYNVLSDGDLATPTGS